MVTEKIHHIEKQLLEFATKRDVELELEKRVQNEIFQKVTKDVYKITNEIHDMRELTKIKENKNLEEIQRLKLNLE